MAQVWDLRPHAIAKETIFFLQVLGKKRQEERSEKDRCLFPLPRLDSRRNRLTYLDKKCLFKETDGTCVFKEALSRKKNILGMWAVTATVTAPWSQRRDGHGPRLTSQPLRNTGGTDTAPSSVRCFLWRQGGGNPMNCGRPPEQRTRGASWGQNSMLLRDFG